MEYLIIILPIVIVVLSSWFLYKALEDEDVIIWNFIVFSILTIAVLYCWLLYAPSLGFISGFFEFMFAAGTSLFSGIALIGYLPRYRKLISLLVIIVSPAVMFVCLNIGINYSPTNIIEKNGEEIAVALEDYYSIEDSYPDRLENLVPEYLEEIKSPRTVWGWLYSREGDEYVLGYVFWVDKYGYRINILRPSNHEWESIGSTLLDHSEDPFNLGPTPTDW